MNSQRQPTVEIDSGSGFCHGVTTAIKKAEEELKVLHSTPLSNRRGAGDEASPLYCLGDIVHNSIEVERLHAQGLTTINHAQLRQLSHAKVLLRAHGEPPETYALARQNHIQIVDATCPVVLRLQQRIKQQYDSQPQAQIVIFGKNGHAEVLGLVGQTGGSAIVVETPTDVGKLDFSRDIYLYAQTTMSLDAFHTIVDTIQRRLQPGVTFKSFDTICRQVANRLPNIAAFAARHDLVIFVSGRKSSNGRVLYNACRQVNPNSHLVERPEEIDLQWILGTDTIGICGATSTPKWLMERCRDYIVEATKTQ